MPPAHEAAVTKCRILHRDISVGNILIYPKIFVADGKVCYVGRVGLLSDWELAKLIDEVARQPHRTVSRFITIYMPCTNLL